MKFATNQELEEKAATYFSSIPEEEWTITGLADYLDTFRSVLCDYEEKDEFSNTVKKIKQKVEMAYEKSLRKNGRSGDIFGLKNFGWKDKNETDLTSQGEKIQGIAVEFIHATKVEGADPGSV